MIKNTPQLKNLLKKIKALSRYTHVDTEGILWRFEGARPVSIIADLVMADLTKNRKGKSLGDEVARKDYGLTKKEFLEK